MRDLYRVGTGQSGAITVTQRTSSDLRLNPHLHQLALDGVFVEDESGDLVFHPLPTLTNADAPTLTRSGDSGFHCQMKSAFLFAALALGCAPSKGADTPAKAHADSTESYQSEGDSDSSSNTESESEGETDGESDHGP